MKVKNLPIFILFLIFLGVNVLDTITSFLIKAGESNPFFTNTYILTFFKILIVLLALYIYNKDTYETNFSRFLFISILVLANLAIMFAVYNNIIGILNPVLIQQAAEMPTEVKTQAYLSFITFMYVIPVLFSLLSFKMYEWSLKHAKTNKPKFNTNEWWNK